MRQPIPLIQEAVQRAKEIFCSPIRVGVDSDGDLQFIIEWAGTTQDGRSKMEWFDHWWIFYAAELQGISFHLELVDPEIPNLRTTTGIKTTGAR